MIEIIRKHRIKFFAIMFAKLFKVYAGHLHSFAPCFFTKISKATYEPRNDKTNKMTVRPAKTQISLGIRPVWSESSLCVQRPKLSSCGQRRLWSDWTDAQADLSLRWANTHFVGFVMSRLIYNICSHSLWTFSYFSALGFQNNKAPTCFDHLLLSRQQQWFTVGTLFHTLPRSGINISPLATEYT